MRMRIGEFGIRYDRYNRRYLDFRADDVANDLIRLQRLIPEFKDPRSEEELLDRLSLRYIRRADLVTAQDGRGLGQDIGFLFSYSFSDSDTYLWLGGVVPEHRNNGLMSAMIDFTQIINPKSYMKVKTYSEFVNMRRLLEEEKCFDLLKESEEKDGRVSMEYVARFTHNMLLEE
ncbi:MAG: hypothetical protein ABIJ18_04120 [archaeon]